VTLSLHDEKEMVEDRKGEVKRGERGEGNAVK
jgi:hypothetical protein